MEKIRSTDLLPPLGGVILLFASFMKWFQYPDPLVNAIQQRLGETPGHQAPVPTVSITAWDLHFLRWVIYLTAVCTVIYFLLALVPRTPGKAAVFLTVVFWAGLICSIAVALRLLNTPVGGADIRSGAWAGLAGALIVCFGSLVTMHDERIPEGYAQAPEPQRLQVGEDASVGPASPTPPSLPPPG